MALPAPLVADLRQMLRQFGAAYGTGAVPTAAGKALEAWLIMRLAYYAKATGRWHAVLCKGDANPLPAGGTFTLPGYQAGILPANSNGPGFVRIENIAHPSISLELHGGLQWKGRSNATHECDVSLLPSDIASPLRAAGGHPRGLPIVAFECKDRTITGNPDEMRQTLARMFDLALVTLPYPGWACRMFEATTNRRWGRHLKRYLWFFGTGAFGIVRVGPFSKGAGKLGRHFRIGLHGNVYTDPRTIAQIERKFVEVIDTIDPVHGI